MKMRASPGFIMTLLVVGFLWFPESSHAATDYATFESFYRPSSRTIWMIGGVAAIFTVIGGAIIFFSGGAASPVVAGAGTWVGGLMGYSGIAATNAGLALLGGGSIVSGGFGIVGGTILLTAALSFGTNVVIDFAAGKAISTYEYSQFAAQSKNMATLPLPRNTKGPDVYETAMNVLKQVNDEESIGTSQNQDVVRNAIKGIVASADNGLTNAEESRKNSLLALLHFVSNDYTRAKGSAAKAYRSAYTAKIGATLPAFIFASSSLYDEKPNFTQVMQSFSYSIKNEPDNPITPLLFSIFLDRAMYRFNDGYLTNKSLGDIYGVSNSISYDGRKAAIQLGLLIRYFGRIKMEQQRIYSLTASENKVIKESPKTVHTVKLALKEYKSLLLASKVAFDDQVTKLDARLNAKISKFDKIKGNGLKDWETQWREKLSDIQPLWASYSQDVTGLEATIRELEQYQANLGRIKPPAQDAVPAKGTTSKWLPYLTAFAGLMIAFMLAVRLQRTR